MHNPAELNESLERRVDLLTEKVLFLELQIKSLTDSQGRNPSRYGAGIYAGR